MNKTLYIFVENFSNSTREEFFEAELPYLSDAFDKLIVMPLYKGNDTLINKNSKIEIKKFNAFEAFNRPKILLKYFFLIIKIFIYEFTKTHKKAFYIKTFTKSLNSVLSRVSAADKLKHSLDLTNKQIVFYSYWFDQWVMILSILKEWNPGMKLVSRAHGSDYREAQVKGVLPFRYYQLNKLSKLLPVSGYAENYMMSKFKVRQDKILVNRLGLPARIGMAPVSGESLVLMSCSALIPLKRVHLIPEILRHITVPVTWYHFGDGPLMNELKEECKMLPVSVTVHIMGYMPNNSVLDFLQNHAISFFMNVSEHEGIPVTFMEAIRCGIPIIGTDICGVPEIVTQQTGKIFPVDFDPKAVANFIQGEHHNGEIYTLAYRNTVRQYFNRNFSADSNYKILSQFLLNLN